MSDVEIIKNAAEGVDSLSTAIQDGWTGEQTFREAWGWNCPVVTRHELANRVKDIADRIRQLASDQIDDDLHHFLSDLNRRIDLIKSETIAYLYNGNCAQAYNSIDSSLNWMNYELDFYLPPKIDWKDIETQKLMPRALLRRLRSIDTQIQNLEGKSGDLSSKIKIINDAHAAAEELPTDLDLLSDAKKQVDEIKKHLSTIEMGSANTESEIREHLENIQGLAVEAEALVVNCGEAYSAATTKGLGEAFDARAKRLAATTWVWAGGLVAALFLGAWLAHGRAAMIKDLLSSQSPSLGMVWINIFLSAFAVAAPVWFAWVATKQIGQRFRLSEDYAFKASVAKAYEGYRREAIKIDGKLAERLFSTALDRIDEAPLRLVEQANPGSPWHDLSERAGRVSESVKTTIKRTRQKANPASAE